MKDRDDEGTELVSSMLTMQDAIDLKRERSEMKIFSNSKMISAQEFKDDGRFTDKNLIEEKNENLISINQNNGKKEMTDSEDSESEKEDQNEKGLAKSFVEEKVECDGRIRRKVVFNNELNLDDVNDLESDDESDNEDSDNNNNNNNSFENVKNEDSANGHLQGENPIKAKIENALNNLKNVVRYNSDDDSSGIDSESGFSTDEEENVNGENEKDENKKRKIINSESRELETKKPKLTEEEEEEICDFETSAVRWKENLAQKASDAFLSRQNNSQNLYKLVYGKI